MESSPLPQIVILHREHSDPAPLLSSLSALARSDFNPDTNVWYPHPETDHLIYRRIDTKYYEAQVQFTSVPLRMGTYHEHLESLGKIEAFIYYITKEEVRTICK
jgi:hypothetical protein